MKKKDATQKSWGKTTGGTSRRGMHHDIMNHYEEVDEARKGARVILQAILDTSATMEHQPTDSVHLCDTCAFFTDSSTAWYINQHKFTFTSCFLHRKNLSLSLSPQHVEQVLFWRLASCWSTSSNFRSFRCTCGSEATSSGTGLRHGECCVVSCHSPVFNSERTIRFLVEIENFFEISHCYGQIEEESTIFQRVHFPLYTLFLLFHPLQQAKIQLCLFSMGTIFMSTSSKSSKSLNSSNISIHFPQFTISVNDLKWAPPASGLTRSLSFFTSAWCFEPWVCGQLMKRPAYR